MCGHVDDLGMAARDDKGEEWKRGRIIIGEPVGIDMGLKMVNGVERFVPEDGKHAGGKGADEKRAE